MQLVIARPTRLAPDALFAWWTDFRDGPEDHAFLKGAHSTRHIVERGEGKLVIEERGKMLGLPFDERYEVRLVPSRREVVLDGENSFSKFFATYRFEPGRAVLETTIMPRGFARLGVGVNKLVARWVLAKDLEGHLREAEKELG